MKKKPLVGNKRVTNCYTNILIRQCIVWFPNPFIAGSHMGALSRPCIKNRYFAFPLVKQPNSQPSLPGGVKHFGEN